MNREAESQGPATKQVHSQERWGLFQASEGMDLNPFPHPLERPRDIAGDSSGDPVVMDKL